ncbi:hypothetical protein ACFLV4_05335 [Chloroflexota bacterium]
MKTKGLILTVSIIALISALILISLRAYYVVVALVVGTLIIGHRELWCLIRGRKLPVLDERVQGNVSKSVRNGFIFFAIASAYLMVFFSINRNVNLEIVHVLGSLFLSVGVIYLLSYVFYDQAEPKLSERGLKVLKIFLLVAGISLAAFIISFFLHNATYGLLIHCFGVDFWDRIGIADEPVFFFIAVIICPLAFAVGIIGSLVVFIKGLLSRSS